MELALSLGDTPKSISFLDHKSAINMVKKELGFCMGLGPLVIKDGSDQIRLGDNQENSTRGSSYEQVQLDLLPLCPVPLNQNQPPSKLQIPWLTHNLLISEPGSSKGQGAGAEVLNRVSLKIEDGASISSPSSTISSFQNQLDLSLNRRGKRDLETISIRTNNYDYDTERKGSDEEEETGLTPKKPRLSKEQSAFLEGSFKQHNTLNPKQKLHLAKQLNMRSRQVEVWFQNRRARTKLKQTEVDREYLKRCYGTLTEENRRLQKEVYELKLQRLRWRGFFQQWLL